MGDERMQTRGRRSFLEIVVNIKLWLIIPEADLSS